MRKIDSFRGEYYFLSNFSPYPVQYEGICYQNAEAAFQAQKCLDRRERLRFSCLTASEAKKVGRKVTLRSDWEDCKVKFMREIVSAKFQQHPEIMVRLLATGDAPLEEGNTWGDRIWGTVNGQGQNLLGKILMEIRDAARATLDSGPAAKP